MGDNVFCSFLFGRGFRLIFLPIRFLLVSRRGGVIFFVIGMIGVLGFSFLMIIGGFFFF